MYNRIRPAQLVFSRLIVGCGLFFFALQSVTNLHAQEANPVENQLNQLLEAGEFKQALSLANAQLAKMLVARGRALQGLGELGEAVAAFEAALNIVPDDPDTKLFLAIAYGREQKHAESAKLLQSIIDGGETSPWVTILLGNAQMQTSEYEKAIASYKTAEQSAGDDAEAKQRANVLSGLAMQHYELESHLKNFLTVSSLQEAQTLTKLFVPSEEILKKIFPDSPNLAAIAAAYAQAVESGEYVIKVPEGRTAIRLEFATSDDMNTGEGTATQMAGGWKALAGQWKPGLFMFDANFCEPGETLGMSYDGFVKVDDRWYWLPKAWRFAK